MAVKKTASPTALFEDLLVKLKNVYKDFYIFRGKYCVPGEESPDSIVGDVICILEPKYQEAISSFLPKAECYHIPSIEELKNFVKNKNVETPDWYLNISELNEFFEELLINKQDKAEYCLEEVTRFEEKFTNNECIWSCIGDNEELIKVIYEDKMIFNLPIAAVTNDGETEYITIAKQLLPLVTAKNISTAFMSVKKSKEFDSLYEVLIDFNFTHFRLEAIYNMIPLPFI